MALLILLYFLTVVNQTPKKGKPIFIVLFLPAFPTIEGNVFTHYEGVVFASSNVIIDNIRKAIHENDKSDVLFWKIHILYQISMKCWLVLSSRKDSASRRKHLHS